MEPTIRNEIERDMNASRETLRSNLEELEGRFKSAVNWREQFRRSPWLGLGLAAGAGFLLAGITVRPKRAHRAAERPSVPAPRPSHLSDAWENMQSALIGIAATHATDLLKGLLTGLGTDGVQGEGDYRAARRYRRSAESYARNADIEGAARGAEPRDEAEAADMEHAEARGRARARPA